MGFNCLKATEPLRVSSLLFTATSQKLLVLILLTSEGWKTDSTLEPPSGFEHETLGLGIQRLNHLAIAPFLLAFLIDNIHFSRAK